MLIVLSDMRGVLAAFGQELAQLVAYRIGQVPGVGSGYVDTQRGVLSRCGNWSRMRGE
ncbi:hypothetical protein [Mycobacteroides salmoniphilum]|uniref:Uncharacterized protein n=1 Tax=Mycobacteroides salmoniphilum TaxID=404941 RepID=A0A4R8SUC5_9MYCO|nr:hypothetical protein [Mycobacteroides salmoniphilum]TDZ89516.1 hypothetical protein CCUG62472_04960 [Mycobacteroides salmoniphilum]TEA04100.1 hypothetical protein CCUG60884_02963 [Mycobacteroides salmoniphilum]